MLINKNIMYIQRELYQKISPFLESKEAIVITGMRRTGKTALLKYLYDKTSTDNKVFLDLENPADQLRLEKTDYNLIPKNLNLDTSKKSYIFIDEIQSSKNLPSVVKYLSDHYNIKFFLTGSASFYIHNMFTESLAGRKYIFELFPFNFREFLKAKGEKELTLKAGEKINEFQFLHYKDLLDEYLRFGGFPKVVLTEKILEKEAYLKDIFSAYWSLEIEKLSDFRKKDKIRDFLFLLMERVGNKIDINKFSKELKITRNTVMDYLSFFRDTYLVSTISPYSTNRDVEIRGAKKMYFIDSGLLNQFARLDKGSLFENVVFNFLQQNNKVQYWQQKDGQEIDFIINEQTAYEVKLSASDKSLKNLTRRAKKIGIKDYKLISYNYSENPQTTYAFLL